MTYVYVLWLRYMCFVYDLFTQKKPTNIKKDPCQSKETCVHQKRRCAMTEVYVFWSMYMTYSHNYCKQVVMIYAFVYWRLYIPYLLKSVHIPSGPVTLGRVAYRNTSWRTHEWVSGLVTVTRGGKWVHVLLGHVTQGLVTHILGFCLLYELRLSFGPLHSYIGFFSHFGLCTHILGFSLRPLHSYIGLLSLIWIGPAIQRCGMTKSYVCHNSFTYLTWLIHPHSIGPCDIRLYHLYIGPCHSYIGPHDSFIYVTWLIHICDTTHTNEPSYWESPMFHLICWALPLVHWASFTCVARLIHMCATTHSYMCHNFSIYIPLCFVT